ncbi:Rrf2 family transcriptional regulator [Aureimonas mangrovi]|uniref:Rrf2 family transcriptional regulator n=1 Tax=Aureimonas mangrovi TaxID=2758041 RepID=UPI00163DC8A5|nr:Rrf2 family transcriptional regulator [Aureimonas mangrovi]
MRTDSRLSGVLHVLLHLADRKEPVTSERLALAMQTNPVVVRRIMAGLRERGYVAAGKGPGGGWSIACDFSRVTLLDIYRAVGEPRLLAIGNRVEAPECLVEQAVNTTLDGAFDAAEALLLERFGEVTLEELLADARRKLGAGGGAADLEKVHAPTR